METQKSWRLLVIRLMSQQSHKRLLLLMIPLLLIGLVDLVYYPILGTQWTWPWLTLFILLVAWGYVAFLFPRSAVSLGSNHLRLKTPLRTLTIPFRNISTFQVSTLEQHFAYDALSPREIGLLQSIFRKSCVQVVMNASTPARQSGKAWVSRFLFTPDGKDILLVVDEWLSLSKAMNAAFVRWQQQNAKDSAAISTPTTTAASLPVSLNRKSKAIPEEKIAETKIAEDAGAEPPIGRAEKISELIRTPTNGYFYDIEPIVDSETPLVLIVDDNRHMISQLEKLLAPYYRVMVARDGKAGMRLTLRLKPDLIVSDIMMPESDGYEFLEFVRNNPESELTPFIMLTGDHDLNSVIRGFEAGVNDYLTKPCDGQELLARIHNLLQQQSRMTQLLELNQRLEERLEAQMNELLVSGDLQQFLPQTVARGVREGQIKNAEDFERRNITVLFADIVGFTPLAERLPPSKLATILNGYLQEMTALATLYDGTVDKFIGDAVLVLFGAPTAVPEADQAWSALQTASAMHYQMKQFSERWASKLSHSFQMRIGVHTGPCVIGVFGSDVLRSYTAIGVGVNTASRLQAQAAPGRTLISRETYELVSDKVLAEPVGTLKLKGVLDAVEAIEVSRVIQ